MNEKTKNYLAGLGACLLFAAIGFLLYYMVMYNDYKFDEYLSILASNNMLSAVIAVCLLPNLIPFHFFLNRNNYVAVKGVLTGMMFWAVVIVWFKYFA